MVDTYSLNPNPIPSPNKSPADKDKTMNMIVVAAAAIVILGLAYWWTTYQAGAPKAADQQADIRAKVAALLSSAPVKASPEEINRVASQLAQSQATATDAQKQKVASLLQNK
ncbi:MAG: hypothetical protein KGI69_03445 [Patescibacteria group bacterium]|nr:hypothetical protein [Patescibacteria group bacterium]